MMIGLRTESSAIRRTLHWMQHTCAVAALTLLMVAPASASADTTDVVRLSTGESLMVEILSVEEEFVTFRHPALGTMKLPRSSVVEILRAVPRQSSAPPVDPALVETSAPAAPAAPPPATAAPPPAPAAPPPAPVEAATSAAVAQQPEEPAKVWKFKLTLGVGGAAGNTENFTGTARFSALRENEASRITFDASYFYGSSNGDKTDSRLTTGLRKDWLLPGSRWFLFARGRYDFDEFQSWRHRAQAFGGAGYRLLERPKFTLDGLVGAGVVKELRSDNEDPRLEGLFGLEGAYDIAENHRFVFASTFYPDLTDIGEFRWTNSAGWSWKFNSKSPMALSAGLAHEYQSQVDANRDRNDVRLFAGVDWDF